MTGTWKAYGQLTLALIAATVIAMGMLAFRVHYTGSLTYSFFSWNLFLAWIPYVLSLLASPLLRSRVPGRMAGWLLIAAWLLFFPNTFYLLTDYIHLSGIEFIVWEGPHLVFNRDLHVWFDLSLFIVFICTGVGLGCVSLHMLQSTFSRIWSATTAKFAVLAILTLTSYGIYLGRFIRLNSWDLFTTPISFAHTIGETLNRHAAGFTFLFTVILTAIYVFFCASAKFNTRD